MTSRVALRPTQPREGTDSARVLAAIDNAHPETSAELAKRLLLRPGDVNSMLYQIGRRYGLVEKVGGRWRRDDSVWQPPPARQAPPTSEDGRDDGGADLAVRFAQPREIPESLRTRVWRSPAVPRRPGSDDYQRVPSRVGDVRVAYGQREPGDPRGAGGGA